MSTQDLLDKYFDAVNHHKWEQLAEIFSPDVTVQHGMSLTTTGREKAVRLLTAVVRQFATHEDIPVRTLVDGHAAAIEIKFQGTKPDGTAVEFDAVDFIDTDGTHITKVASWYDTAVVLPMLQG